MAGHKQQIVKPESLINAHRKAGEVVHVSSSLCRLDDGDISNGPEEHVGCVPHANVSEEVAEWPKASTKTGRDGSSADESA
eukprot:3222392-Lingulodinium_polyedra.AAC.1